MVVLVEPVVPAGNMLLVLYDEPWSSVILDWITTFNDPTEAIESG